MSCTVNTRNLEAMYMYVIILHVSNAYHIVRKELISQDKNLSDL